MYPHTAKPGPAAAGHRLQIDRLSGATSFANTDSQKIRQGAHRRPYLLGARQAKVLVARIRANERGAR